MKTCKQCQTQYEFYGQRTLLCKECWRTYQRKHYHEKRDKNKKYSLQQIRIKKLRQFIINYLKENPCNSCGETDPVVLEFHHVDPNLKQKSIANMRANSIPTLQKEIAKCEVLCANCHRRKTALQYNWTF